MTDSRAGAGKKKTNESAVSYSYQKARKYLKAEQNKGKQICEGMSKEQGVN